MKPDLQPTIVIDTREPGPPHPWGAYLTSETIRGTLETGDLSLLGCEEWICLERKALNDLIGCLTTSRDRFTRELQRAARVRDFFVIVEGSYADLLKGNYHSEMNPRSAWESVIALQQRYGIPFFFAGGIEVAAKLAESILLRWFKEHQKAVDTAITGTKKLAGTEARS